MKSVLIALSAVLAVATPAVIPLGYTVTPKITRTACVPTITNVPVTTTVPVVTNIPITVPSCGCGLEVATIRSYSGYEPLFPPCNCGCGCGCETVYLSSCDCVDFYPPCGCLEVIVPTCGQLSTCNTCNCGVPTTSCINLDPVTTCGCTAPLLQLDVAPCCETLVTVCGVPTLPPIPPTVGCCGCGKYLRQICIQPPFL